jgi:hypothetical protein
MSEGLVFTPRCTNGTLAVAAFFAMRAHGSTNNEFTLWALRRHSPRLHNRKNGLMP